MLHSGNEIYPAGREATGTAAWVRVAFLVRPDGTPDPCSIRVQGSSDKAFEQPGMAMILNSRFSRPPRPTYVEQIIRWQVT